MFKAICHRRCSTFHFRTLSQITVPHLPNHTTAPPTPTINPLHYHHHCQISTYSPQLKDNNSNEETNKNPIPPPKIFVVQPRLRPESVLKAKLSEALNLANSLEQQRDGYYDTEFSDKPLPPHLVVQNPAARTTRADTFFGPGTVSNIKCHMNALESEDELDAIFVNAILSGVQQRNLERAWDTPVLDRVGLIIEIFNAHAQTKEAKLQAELAALMYKKTRLVRVRGIDGRLGFGTKGESEVVSAKGRGSGGRGFISGAGETELQLQRRRILDRRIQLLSEIKDVRRTRAVQRAARRRRGGLNGEGMPTVAIVGYTNAGKSTLVSELSDSYLFCDDRLFATVDPKLRSVDLPSGKKVLLSDTVGFISDLPVQLVEAFHATLEEVVEADLLVHVLDSSAPDLEHQRESVLQVLQQIGVSKEKLQNMIEVWNKIDLQVEELEEDDCASEEEEEDEEISEDVEEVEDEKSEDLCDELLLLSEDENNENDNEIEMDYEIPNEQESEIINTDEKIWAKDIESIPHVKTSAITRVGLQDLLQLIDDKLKCDEIPERGIFDRKWRPPQLQDNGIAVEK